MLEEMVVGMAEAIGGKAVISEDAREALRNGSTKLRVSRSGMFQKLTFNVKRIAQGNATYVELYTDRTLDISELSRIANELGLPVESQNGRAFPKGTSASDFQGL